MPTPVLGVSVPVAGSLREAARLVDDRAHLPAAENDVADALLHERLVAAERQLVEHRHHEGGAAASKIDGPHSQSKQLLFCGRSNRPVKYTNAAASATDNGGR